MPDNIKLGPNIFAPTQLIAIDNHPQLSLFNHVAEIIGVSDEGTFLTYQPGLGEFNSLQFLEPDKAYQLTAKQGFFLPDVVPPLPLLPYTVTLRADFNRLDGVQIFFNDQTEKYEVLAEIDFQEADIGKLIAIEEARSYPEYVAAPITLNGRIIGINQAWAIIEQLDKDSTGAMMGTPIVSNEPKFGFCATNNWQALQDGIDYCAANNIKTLYLDHTGTAYINPTQHAGAQFAARQYANKINSDLVITGRSSGVTKLKYGPEDIQTFGSKMINYSGFVLGNCSFYLENIVMISADRVSTKLDNQLVQAITSIPVHTNQVSNQNIFCNKVYILSVDALKCQGWGSAIYMNNSSLIPAGKLMTQEFKNGRIEAQAGPSFFNAQTGNIVKDNAGRVQRISNAVIYAGARYSRQVIGSVKVTAGSDIVEVLGNEWFSFYDLQNYIDNGSDKVDITFQLINVPLDISYPYTGPTVGPTAEPSSKILDTDETLFCRISEVIGPRKAKILVDGSASPGLPNTTYQLPAFTSTTCSLITCEGQPFRWAAFHALYISGNVASQLADLDAHALLYIRNRQNYYEGSPIADTNNGNVNCIKDLEYPEAEALRFLYQGNGYQRNAQYCGMI